MGVFLEMRHETVKRWIAAGKRIAADPEDKVLRPLCLRDYLQINDIVNDSNPSEFERHMKCNLCGAYNVLRLSR